jgi:hypothetical protein
VRGLAPAATIAAAIVAAIKVARARPAKQLPRDARNVTLRSMTLLLMCSVFKDVGEIKVLFVSAVAAWVDV